MTAEARTEFKERIGQIKDKLDALYTDKFDELWDAVNQIAEEVHDFVGEINEDEMTQDEIDNIVGNLLEAEKVLNDSAKYIGNAEDKAGDAYELYLKDAAAAVN